MTFQFLYGIRYHVRCHIVYPSTFDIWLAEFILPDIIHVLVHNLFFLPKNGLPLSGFKNVSEDVWTVPANILYIKKYICYNHTYSLQKIQHVRFWEASKKQTTELYHSTRLTTTQALRLPWSRPIWAWMTRHPRHLEGWCHPQRKINEGYQKAPCF